MWRRTNSSSYICRPARSLLFEKKDPELSFFRRLRSLSSISSFGLKAPFERSLLFWLLLLPMGGSLKLLSANGLKSLRLLRWKAMLSRLRSLCDPLSYWLIKMLFYALGIDLSGVSAFSNL